MRLFIYTPEVRGTSAWKLASSATLEIMWGDFREPLRVRDCNVPHVEPLRDHDRVENHPLRSCPVSQHTSMRHTVIIYQILKFLKDSQVFMRGGFMSFRIMGWLKPTWIAQMKDECTFVGLLWQACMSHLMAVKITNTCSLWNSFDIINVQVTGLD